MKPSFLLDFTTGVTLNPSVTFSRASGATQINASGVLESVGNDAPRFDYNPVTLACNGLLIEESRVNIETYSEDFSNAQWTKTEVSLGAKITSPDNATNGQLIVPSTNTAAHWVRNVEPVTAGTTYTFSIYAKAENYAFLQLAMSTGFNITQFQNFDLSDGTLGSASGITGSVTNAGGGWHRCSVTAVATTTASGAIAVAIVPAKTSSRFASLTGDGASGLYIWGAQLEAGAFSTSYIPTTTTAVTRNADVATITGTNFSDFWQASKGGAQVQAIPSTVSGIRPLVQYDDGTADNIIALRGNAANPELQIVDGGAPQVQLDAGTIVANTPYSLTAWWQTNDCKARQNSGAAVSDYTATIPTVTQARLGSDGTNYLNGHLATINYYDSFFGQSIYTRCKNKVFASLL